MSFLRLIFVSFLHHWRMNLAVALGAAAGTAVLTGALVVGDSMRGSLRSRALDRLGKIDEVLAPRRFFREKLADELKETNDYRLYGKSLVPAILVSTSLENPDNQIRANRVEVVGCKQDFWQLGTGGPQAVPNANQIDLNEPLAEKLGVKVGDEIILRLPKPGVIPSDSALGEKRDTVVSHRLTIRNILPAVGLGRFSLQSSQQTPLNAYIPLDWLQGQLEQSGKVNALFLSLTDEGNALVKEVYNTSALPTGFQNLVASLRSKLTGTPPDLRIVTYASDLGILVYKDFEQNMLPINYKDAGLQIENSPSGYLNVTSDRMVLERDVEKQIVSSVQSGVRKNGEDNFTIIFNKTDVYDIQPAFTYLANSIATGGHEIPYSTITGIDFATKPPLGPFLSLEGKPLPPLQDNEIALNSWAADNLKAKIGDTIQVFYFQPESTHGQIREKTVELILAAIVQLAGAADDRDLTPKVKGITDELTMADWDPPFPFDAKRIRPQDEKYWDDHGPTPKAFVSLDTGRKLWGSRFGKSTSIRIAAKNADPQAAEKDLRELQEKLVTSHFYLPSLGFTWQPVKLQALAAAQGTTPFNVLFMAFSFFIIVSALMLVLLLFKLGIERRAAEIGILLAVGWKPKKVRKLLFQEGVLTAIAGGAIGVPLGVGYAALMLWGLQTWWLAAIVTPFLKLYVTPGSLAIGFLAGFCMAMITIFFAVRKIVRIAPRKLLAGQVQPESRFTTLKNTKKIFRWLDVLWGIFLLGNLLVWIFAGKLGQFETGMFFGGGAMMLVLTLLVLWSHLRRGATGSVVAVGKGNLFRLAFRNAARNPGRSTLTIGLVASACFLIIAVSAFQLDPSQQTPQLTSGNGGFALVAESSQPIFQNLDTPDGRGEIGFSDDDEKLLATCHIYSLRVRAGDDASCLNLYRPRSPRVLGLPGAFCKRGGFAWANVPADCENPWSLLDVPERSQQAKADEPNAMILEKNTANYSLNLWSGLGEIYEYQESPDRSFPLQVAALLDNSIFQGDLLIAEASLLKKFPDTVGYRFFLVECPAEQTAEVQKILEDRLGDYGFTAETTGQRLARFLAVQNTYLSTFQSLGGLGLLLGTLGLAAVQLRNIIERRGELALLRAVGFSRKKLANLVLLENAVLLVLGLGSGILAALVAVMPHFLSTNAHLPWMSLSGTLVIVFLVGMLAGLAAVRQVLKAPLLHALREEK